MKILFDIYSNTRKLIFCTRCLRHFNYERYLKQHEPHCPNEVDPDNMIDSLKVTGGYSKEISKRQVEGLIRHAKKLEEELQSNDQDLEGYKTNPQDQDIVETNDVILKPGQDAKKRRISSAGSQVSHPLAFVPPKLVN